MEKKVNRTLMEKVRRRSIQAEFKATGGHPESAGFHRSAYHRAFEGYAEVKELNAQGKVVIRRVYVEKYYEPALTRTQKLTLRACYILCFLIAAVFYFQNATARIPANSLIFVAAFQAAAIPFFLWLAYILLFYTFQMKKMTIGEYKTLHGSLVRCTGIARFVFAGLFWAMVIALAFDRSMWAKTLFGAFYALLSAAAIEMIYWLESNLQYDEIANENAMPPAGIEINLGEQ